MGKEDGDLMEQSIRNEIPGTVKEIISDKVLSEVIVETAVGDVAAIITTRSVHDMGLKDRGRESASSPSLRTGQALFTHPALQLMGSNSETEDFEFYDSLWRYRPCSRAAVRLNSPASSKKRLRHR